MWSLLAPFNMAATVDRPSAFVVFFYNFYITLSRASLAYAGVRPMDNLFQGLCDGLEDEEKGGNESSKSDALAEVGEDRKIASSVNISTAAHMSSSNSLRSTATTSTTSSNSAHPPLPPPPAASFTFAEIFAGIGGFRLGLEPLGGRYCIRQMMNKSYRFLPYG